MGTAQTVSPVAPRGAWLVARILSLGQEREEVVVATFDVEHGDGVDVVGQCGQLVGGGGRFGSSPQFNNRAAAGPPNWYYHLTAWP